jgi:hypothetical protein
MDALIPPGAWEQGFKTTFAFTFESDLGSIIMMTLASAGVTQVRTPDLFGRLVSDKLITRG